MIHSRASQLPPDVRTEYPFAGNLFDQPPVKGGGEPVKMHFVDEGQGPVVLLLHGNPTWSFYYRRLVKRLVRDGFRCIVPDHVGCGLSDKPADYPYTLERRIEDVERLLDHLGIDRFNLVVHDWGGAIGFGVAGRRPEAVGDLAVLNTGAFRSMRIPLRIAAVKLPLIGESIIRAMNGFAGPAVRMSVTVPLAPAVHHGMLWPYRSWADRVAIWNFVRDIPLRSSHPSYEALVQVESGIPKLQEKRVKLFWGGRDFCFNNHFYNRWLELMPKARSSFYGDCGHYVLEDGGERILDDIAGFFTEEGPQN